MGSEAQKMNLTFRDAVEEDLEAIVAIYNSTVPSRMVTADTEPVTVTSRVPWFKAHTSWKRPLWVAETEGEICGWLSFQSFYGRPAYDGTVEVSVYVAEKHRQKKIGQNLLELAINKLRAEAQVFKIRTLLAFIFGHNTPSVRLFEKFGFQQWAKLPQVAEMDGEEYDLLILGLRLEEAAK